MNLFTLLNANNYHTFNREIARKIGLEAAIMLSEIVDKFCHFESKGWLKEGWFYLTIEDVEERTTLSRRHQDTAIQDLKNLGFIETKQMGMPAKRHFRIFKEKITEWLNCTNKKDKNAKQGCTYSPTLNGESVQPVPLATPIVEEPNEEPEDVCIASPSAPQVDTPLGIPQTITKTNLKGEGIKVSLPDIFTKAVLENKDWTTQEINQSWEILCSYSGKISNSMSFFEGTVKNLRNKKKSEFINKKDQSCKMKTKPKLEIFNPKSLVEDLKEPRSLKSMMEEQGIW